MSQTISNIRQRILLTIISIDELRLICQGSSQFALLSRVTLASAGLSCTNEHAGGQLLVGPNALWPTQPKFWVGVAYRGVAHSAHAAAPP